MNRRMFLRSAATTLWLPLLPSALPRTAWSAPGSPGPRRMMYWFVPNGLHREGVTPGGRAADQVLAPLRDRGMVDRVSQISRLQNLTNPNTYTTHQEATSSALTDVAIGNGFGGGGGGGGGVSAGVSADQWAAEAVGTITPMPSLQLGLDETPQFTGNNFATYTNTISWGRGNRPLTKVTDARRLFMRMYQGTAPTLTDRTRELRASVLDAVLERANDMDRRLAHDDHIKLEQYMDSVREVERQLEGLEAFECPRPSPPQSGLWFDKAHQAMADVMVLALQCDFTRIITFMSGPSVSYTVFSHLGHTTDNHTHSHTSVGSASFQRHVEIQQWYVDQFARTAEAMAQVPEGDGDMLSNTVFTMLSEFADPNVHDAHDMTYLLAGGEGGGIQQGRHLSVNQSHGNYHRSMLDFMGVDSSRFGQNATGSLDLS